MFDLRILHLHRLAEGMKCLCEQADIPQRMNVFDCKA